MSTRTFRQFISDTNKRLRYLERLMTSVNVRRPNYRLGSGIVDTLADRDALQNVPNGFKAIIDATGETYLRKGGQWHLWDSPVWTDLSLNVTTVQAYSNQIPRMAILQGSLVLRGGVRPSVAGQSFSTSYTDMAEVGAIPELPGVRQGFDSARIVPGPGGSPPARMFIEVDGSMRIASTTGTSSYYLLNSSYPILY